MSINTLKRLIFKTKEALSDIEYLGTDPAVKAASEALDKAREAALLRRKPELEALLNRLKALKADLAEEEARKERAAKDKQDAMPEFWRQYIEDCQMRMRVSWVSPSGRYALISRSGEKYWSSLGTTSYAPSTHSVVDAELVKSKNAGVPYARRYRGHSLWIESVVRTRTPQGDTPMVEWAGRLTKEILNQVKETYK